MNAMALVEYSKAAWQTFEGILEWYLNRYSTRFNQGCDICWAGYIAFVHLLYGSLPLYQGAILLIITQAIKLVFPTDHDKGVESEST